MHLAAYKDNAIKAVIVSSLGLASMKEREGYRVSRHVNFRREGDGWINESTRGMAFLHLFLGDRTGEED